MQTADFYSSATGTLRVNGGRDENAPQGVSLSIDDLSYIKQGSHANDAEPVTDYDLLDNKPQINNITLTGNKSLNDLGIQPKIDSSHKVSADNIDDTDATNKFATAAQLAQITTNQNNILSVQDKFKTYNVFNKDTAEIVSIMCNAQMVFVTGGGVQSTIWACKPNTTYTVSWNKINNNSRFIVYLSTNTPVVDTVSKANSSIFIDTTISGSSRQYKTFTTGANDNYMLIYFWVNSTGGEDTLNTIQISEGNTLYDYTSYNDYAQPNLAIFDTNLSPNFGINSCQLGVSTANIVSNKQLGQLEKGYICIVADDGTSDVANVTFPISQNKNIPITLALWTQSACVTDTTLLSQLRTAISTYGCSVCQHGVGEFTSYNSADLYNYLLSELTAWAGLSINVKGLAYPNHARNEKVKAICGSLFDVCCSGGANRPLVYSYDTAGARSNIYDLYRVSLYSSTLQALKNSCDYAKNNKKIFLVFYHDNDIAGDAEQITKLNDMIDYAKSISLDFITVGDIINIL